MKSRKRRRALARNKDDDDGDDVVGGRSDVCGVALLSPRSDLLFALLVSRPVLCFFRLHFHFALSPRPL